MASVQGLQVLSYTDLISEGKRLIDSSVKQQLKREEPRQDSIIMLGVTSGTTGEPKSAMLTHMNFISGQVAGDWLGFDFSENDVYLSYAPLTHVQEQIIHLNAVLYSFKIGYSSGDIKMLVNDI